MDAKKSIEELVAIMARLRAEDGCPWDRQQTLTTLKTYLLEEAYEVLEAIENGDSQAHREELGDLLFQIVFQCQLAAEKGDFDIYDVIGAIAAKIRRRHPHVFGDARVENAEQVVANWEKIKRQEKGGPGGRTSALDGLPPALPALLRAHRLSERAARVGFDWKLPEEVAKKAEEEWRELREAMAGGDVAAIEDELGDVFFALANLARHLKLVGEDAARAANRRFERRFRLVEKLARERGLEMKNADIDALEALWQEAKSLLREGSSQPSK